MTPAQQQIEAEFWKLVNKRGPIQPHVKHLGRCWQWGGRLWANGYGAFKKNGRSHRLSWELTNGQIPSGVFVLHKCDNRACVNPEHLFLGNGSDNMRDCVSKGRHDSLKRLGEKHPRARLKWWQAVRIKSSTKFKGMIIAFAKEFNVAPSTVSAVVNGKTWAWLKTNKSL